MTWPLHTPQSSSPHLFLFVHHKAAFLTLLSLQIEMAQKLLNSDLGELINKMKLAQQYVMTSLQQEYKKQMLTAAHALAVDAKNLLDVIDQARLKALGQPRPH